MASITDCVSEGLKYPFNDVKKLLVLGAIFALLNLATPVSLRFTHVPANSIYVMAALGIVSFIITLFVMGYQYDVVKFSIDKREDLPGFTDIMNIFVKGIKILIVAVAYNVIPAIVLIIGAFLAGDYTGPAVVVILISAILFIIAFFLQIMAVNNMVANDSLGKAFDFRQIIDMISNLGWGKYIGIVLFTFIVLIIVNVAVGYILSFISLFIAIAANNAMIVSVLVGIIQGLFITSYTSLFYNRVCGSIYREAIK
nr:DUF4013 domain-containing protein [uncultured Methanobrevibacter sp.]